MAGQSTKSNTRKRTTKPTKASNTLKNTNNSMKANHPSKDTSLSMVQYELLAVLILVCTLFIMISIYLGSGGIVGKIVRSLLFGVFGVSAWIVPIAIFIATFFKVFNKGNERLNIKILLSFLLIIFISVAAHIVYVDAPQIHVKLQDRFAIFASLSNYYKVASMYHVGGGFIGGLVGDIFLIFLGRIGASFILVSIFIALTIAITEKSFIIILKGIYAYIVKSVKKWMIYLSQKTLEYKEQRELEIEKAEVEKAEIKKTETEKVETEKVEAKSKHRFMPSLFKSTLEKEEPYDIVKHIEQKENQEALNKEESFSRLFDEAATQLNETDMSKDMKTSSVEEVIIVKKPEVHQTKIKIDTEPIKQEIIKELAVTAKLYKSPPMELLKANPLKGNNAKGSLLQDNSQKLVETLASFGVGAKVIGVSVGPSVTRYELQPDQGVKVSKIVNLADDIALNLAASGIRIEAPIPNKSAVGIEVPNKDVSSVFLREVIDSKEFEESKSKLSFALGMDIGGNVVVADIAKMPHLLIAGATGSGKSVCINTLITSILYKSSPEEVKLLMIDPKVVELSIYNGIPHLLIPVVVDPKKAANALNWAVQEMLERYKLFAAANVRDIRGYNKMVVETGEMKKLPQIVIIVDELADLMVAAAGDVEEAICRLAQMARAAGLHLIIATQRPSVDVITGLIKANIPSRIAFNVSSGVDSRTIIDMNGAEKLLGKGDMLFYPVGLQKPVRIQGAFISDKEVENIVTFLKDKKKEEYDEKIMKQLDKTVSEDIENTDERDPIFEDALALCVDMQKASASMIQRRFRVGYNRAARILDQLYDAGYVGEDEGSKPRKMMLTKEAFEELKQRANSHNGSEQDNQTDNETDNENQTADLD